MAKRRKFYYDLKPQSAERLLDAAIFYGWPTMNGWKLRLGYGEYDIVVEIDDEKKKKEKYEYTVTLNRNGNYEDVNTGEDIPVWTYWTRTIVREEDPKEIFNRMFASLMQAD